MKPQPAYFKRSVSAAAAMLVGVVMSVAPARAVLFDSTGDPNFNTAAPTALLAGSGWQYEATFGGFLATPIAPNFFIAAKHVGGSIGSTVVYQGITYTTDSYVDSPNSDLRIWHVTASFSTYAPLYTGSDVVGKDLVFFGRGNERGANITLNGALIGWGWNTTSPNLERWGTNVVASRLDLGSPFGTTLYATFDHGASATEATVSGGDSGGGVFIKDPADGVWKLAGINLGADGTFATDASGTGSFNAALFDMRGYYAQNPAGAFNLVSGASPVPAGMYATEIASNLPFILGTISDPSKNVSPGQISKGAYKVIANRVGAVRNGFYVYKDADSGENHGFASGLFGNRTSIHIQPACVDDPAAPGGISISATRTDSVRGTVMAISFDPQAPGTFAGINFEEPENWGVNKSVPGNGYDLRGAANLVFDVRSPTAGGVWVQFGVGGGTTGYWYIPQSTTYKTMRIPLASLSPAVDLSNVHILFSVAANDAKTAAGGAILLDNIHFDPTPTSRGAALGFPLATQTFGILPGQAAPYPLDQALRNGTSIYESSLAMATLLRRGYPADISQARLIADTFDYALAHENHGDNLPAAPGGFSGLHNGYSSGDIGLFNKQASPKTGQAGDVRIAGFSTTAVTPSGYAAVLDGATGGNNAFAILALTAAFKQFNDPRYLADAQKIGNWIYGNLLDTAGTGYGGYFVGYGDQGVPPPKPLLTGKSTENNADIFSAFTALAKIDPANAAEWTRRANIAGDFVMRMFDAAGGHFYAGTSPVGTFTDPSAGSAPDPSTALGNDVINKFDFLDVNSFAALAMAGASRYTAQINWRRPVQYVISNFSKSVTTGSGAVAFQGFGLVRQPVSRMTNGAVTSDDGIAWEFTGQMVVAMRFVDALYGETGFGNTAQFYLNQISKAQASAPFGDASGLVAATVQAGDALPPLRQGLNTPHQDIPERVGLAATTWAVFADKNINVFSLPDVLPVIPGDVTRDMNGDGTPDLIFQNGVGQVYAWFLNGTGSLVDFTTGTGLKGTGPAGAGYLYSGGL